MAVIPVWVRTWQLECCGDDVSIGDPWEVALVTFGTRIEATDAREVGWSVTGFGEIGFVARAAARGPNGGPPVVLDMGGIRVGTLDAVDAGVVRGHGRVHGDWHGHLDTMDVSSLDEEVEVRGLVRAVHRVPEIYRDDGWMVVPIGEEAPTAVQTTKDRHGASQLLVELDVGPTSQPLSGTFGPRDST